MVEVMNRLSHRYLPWRWFRIVDSVDASMCCGKLMLKVASKKRESQTFGKINSVFVIYLIMCHAALITWRPHRSAVMPPPRYSHAVATPSPHRCCDATAVRQDTGHATRSFTTRCKTARITARNGPFRSMGWAVSPCPSAEAAKRRRRYGVENKKPSPLHRDNGPSVNH